MKKLACLALLVALFAPPAVRAADASDPRFAPITEKATQAIRDSIASGVLSISEDGRTVLITRAVWDAFNVQQKKTFAQTMIAYTHKLCTVRDSRTNESLAKFGLVGVVVEK